MFTLFNINMVTYVSLITECCNLFSLFYFYTAYFSNSKIIIFFLFFCCFLRFFFFKVLILLFLYYCLLENYLNIFLRFYINLIFKIFICVFFLMVCIHRIYLSYSSHSIHSNKTIFPFRSLYVSHF